MQQNPDPEIQRSPLPPGLEIPLDIAGPLAIFTPEQQREILRLSAEMADAYGQIRDIVMEQLRAHSEIVKDLTFALAPLLVELLDPSSFLERIKEIQEWLDSLRLQETKQTLPWTDGLPTPRNVEGWRDRPQIVKGSQNTRPRREPWIRR